MLSLIEILKLLPELINVRNLQKNIPLKKSGLLPFSTLKCLNSQLYSKAQCVKNIRNIGRGLPKCKTHSSSCSKSSLIPDAMRIWTQTTNFMFFPLQFQNQNIQIKVNFKNRCILRWSLCDGKDCVTCFFLEIPKCWDYSWILTIIRTEIDQKFTEPRASDYKEVLATGFRRNHKEVHGTLRL